jgi:hypothetical protein
MVGYYDRYEKFRKDGSFMKIPPIKIDKYNSDLMIVFDKERMRLDNLSYKYYGDPNFGWLLMLANPEYGSMEYNIPDKVKFRIPYPFDSAISRYEQKVSEYFKN